MVTSDDEKDIVTPNNDASGDSSDSDNQENDSDVESEDDKSVVNSDDSNDNNVDENKNDNDNNDDDESDNVESDYDDDFDDVSDDDDKSNNSDKGEREDGSIVAEGETNRDKTSSTPEKEKTTEATPENVAARIETAESIVEEISNINGTAETFRKKTDDTPSGEVDKKDGKVDEVDAKQFARDILDSEVDPKSMKIDYRTTLIEFYKLKNPEKTKNVDSLLERCKGKEDELLRQIEKAYKLEQLPTLTYLSMEDEMTADNYNESTALKENPHRTVLVDFYAKHNPEKVKDVDTILKKYEGREAKLFELIEKSYNVSIAGDNSSHRQQLAKMKAGSNSHLAGSNSHLASVPETEALKENPHRTKLIEFYAQHNPKKLKDVDKILQKYHGKETKLFKLLEKAYNVSLLSSGDNTNYNNNDRNGQSAGSKTVSDDTYRASLVEFYKEYKPEKVGDVDNLLKKYKGKIETLFTRIESNYSARPTIDPQTTDGNSAPKYDVGGGFKNNSTGMVSVNLNDEVNGTPVSECSSEQIEIFRKRLTVFYRVHNPEKIKNVDKLLDKFRGNEVELFKRIEEAYEVEKPLLPGVTSSNPTPKPPPPVPTRTLTMQPKPTKQFQFLPTSSNIAVKATEEAKQLQNRNRLVEFYTKHRPEKLKDVDQILQKFKGNMDEVFKFIEQQYKVTTKQKVVFPIEKKETDPVEVEIYRDCLMEFYKEFNPEKISDVDYLLEFYQGREDVLFRRMKFAYNVNPFRPNLVTFYTLNNPEKLKNVDILLEKYEGKELRLIKRIKDAYKKEEKEEEKEEAEQPEQQKSSSPPDLTESVSMVPDVGPAVIAAL